ncbi:hypothetical protein Dsin_031886 [Dipteronia sinensis]|uniref:Glycine-rich protein n=1 Tax=Dipteronia sinensis TaxID=43782 RepID=A0AAD9ZME2_9ROSI|nr:hypothetical protein Dsin_031886 [Dipteronia sinensis]
MARILLLSSAPEVVSIMSMVMFVCVEGPPNKDEEGKEKEKSQVEIDAGAAVEAGGHVVGCCGCGGGGGDGGGCGGCGGD